MSWIDWLITLIPAAFVIFMGFYCRRYIVGVSDYLVASPILWITAWSRAAFPSTKKRIWQNLTLIKINGNLQVQKELV